MVRRKEEGVGEKKEKSILRKCIEPRKKKSTLEQSNVYRSTTIPVQRGNEYHGNLL